MSEENEGTIGPIITCLKAGHEGGRTSGTVVWRAQQNLTPKSNAAATGQNWPKQAFQYSGDHPEAFKKMEESAVQTKPPNLRQEQCDFMQVLAWRLGRFYWPHSVPHQLAKWEPAVSLLEAPDLIWIRVYRNSKLLDIVQNSSNPGGREMGRLKSQPAWSCNSGWEAVYCQISHKFDKNLGMIGMRQY